MEKLTKQQIKEQKKIERLREEARVKKQERIKKIAIGAGILALIVGVIFGLTKLSNPQTTPVLTGPPAVTREDMTNNAKNAKATLIEYSDFQCPACAKYHLFVKKLMNDFSGKVLVVYRFFPLPQHQNAISAAKAAYAAGLQGKFWEMQDLLFENQDQWTQQKEADKVFEKYAQSLSLDMTRFKTDFNSKETLAKIENDFRGGEKAGINSTPTFFLNNKQVETPKSYEEFRKLIEKELQ